MNKTGKETFARILQAAKDEPFRRMAAKVPQWGGVEGLLYPTLLCTEQCSGSAAALLKANEAAALCPDSGFEIADLTAGIGVDCWAFSTAAARVLHNERDPRLSAAARHNLSLLGLSGIEFSDVDLTPETVEPLLANFFTTPHPSARICYLDPARRSSTGSKVFRIKDCSPNILELLPVLFKHARFVMIKLSPMADIDLCVKELNGCATGSGAGVVTKVICSGAVGECKEILFILDREHNAEPVIQVREDGFEFSFTREEEKNARAILCTRGPLASEYLFEPGKALSKAGAFKLTSQRFKLEKLDSSTQLYCSGSPVPELMQAGKWFRILETAEFCGANIRDYSKRYPQCEISARNLPVSSDELRTKMSVAAGGDTHIFATLANGRRILLATKKI